MDFVVPQLSFSFEEEDWGDLFPGLSTVPPIQSDTDFYKDSCEYQDSSDCKDSSMDSDDSWMDTLSCQPLEGMYILLINKSFVCVFFFYHEHHYLFLKPWLATNDHG